MNGWFKLFRGWMDSPVFAKEPFTEREAWLWLIENASIDATTINIGGSPVKLKRGELSHSLRFLADQWGWHRAKTDRYLKKLEKWSMIETAARQGQTIITICNYREYQDKQNKEGT